jgi:hypothetical protein
MIKNSNKEVWKKPTHKALKFKETRKGFNDSETGTLPTTAVGPS